MKAENQSMLIEEAEGQKTLQALFMQTANVEHDVILNCQFERDPQDGKLYYVFTGTSDHYMQFRELMKDYAVHPVHEIEGHRLNPKTAEAAEQPGETAPVVDTAPASTKSSADVGETPPELSVTEGETVQPEPSDEPSIRRPSEPSNGGQPASGAAGQAGQSAGRDDVHGEADAGRSGTAGRGARGEAAQPNASRAVRDEVDPFADLNV